MTSLDLIGEGGVICIRCRTRHVVAHFDEHSSLAVRVDEAQSAGSGDGDGMSLTPKTEKLLREHALKQIFGKLRRSSSGNHKTKKLGQGEDNTGELKAYQFGDALEKIDITESIKNSQIRCANNEFTLQQDDLVV